MSDSTQAANVTAADDFEANRAKTKKALPALLIVFTLGTLMIQAFNLVFQNIGDSLGMSASASLISTLPGIVLGVVCMLYGTLCDFISPKRMTLFGVSALVIGSLLGFFGSFNFWVVLVARMIQVAGAQVAGSVFLVMTVKYLDDKEKAVYIGIYNAVYYLAAAIGVFAGGFITSFDWKYLFLVPAISVFFIPLLIKNTPDISAKGERIDGFGIALFAVFAGLIAVYFSFPNVWLLVAIVLLGIAFVAWILKGSKPFLSKSFITNKAYMSILLLQFVFYFFNFACVPIYNVIGEQLYDAADHDLAVPHAGVRCRHDCRLRFRSGRQQAWPHEDADRRIGAYGCRFCRIRHFHRTGILDSYRAGLHVHCWRHRGVYPDLRCRFRRVARRGKWSWRRHSRFDDEHFCLNRHGRVFQPDRQSFARQGRTVRHWQWSRRANI